MLVFLWYIDLHGLFNAKAILEEQHRYHLNHW